MSFFKHLVRGWMGGGNYGHHGKRRYGHHGGYPGDDGYDATSAPGVVCAKCNTRNAAGARFCAQCGASLQAVQCSACGAEAPPGARFCPDCGQAFRPGE